MPYRLLFTFLLLGLFSCSRRETQEDASGGAESPMLQASPSSDAESTVVDLDLGAYLSGKLKKLDETGQFTRMEFSDSKKYYAFYETTSTCVPCHSFSPTLNTFYDVLSDLHGGRFELVVVSYDLTEELMRQYAAEKMPDLPHLQYDDKNVLKKELPFLREQYPNLIITDGRGKVLKSSFDQYGRFHGPEVAMNYLKVKLLEQQ